MSLHLDSSLEITQYNYYVGSEPLVIQFNIRTKILSLFIRPTW